MRSMSLVDSSMLNTMGEHFKRNEYAPPPPAPEQDLTPRVPSVVYPRFNSGELASRLRAVLSKSGRFCSPGRCGVGIHSIACTHHPGSLSTNLNGCETVGYDGSKTRSRDTRRP